MESSTSIPAAEAGVSHAPALERGMRILETLASRPEGATLSEISEAVDSPKNSTLRLLQTLVTSGYLFRKEAPPRYRLTGKLLRLAQPHIGEVSLVECALESMRGLRDRVGETVQLGIPTGDEGVIIEKLESSAAIRIGVAIGLRFPLHNNAPGKILLAYQADKDREATLGRIELPRSTARTITDPVALERECQRVLEMGYAVDWGEAAEGIHCVAAPVRDRLGGLVATLWVSGIAGRMPKKSFPSVGEEVRQAAAEIESRMRG